MIREGMESPSKYWLALWRSRSPKEDRGPNRGCKKQLEAVPWPRRWLDIPIIGKSSECEMRIIAKTAPKRTDAPHVRKRWNEEMLSRIQEARILTAERIHAMVGSASREATLEPMPEPSAVAAPVVRFAVANKTAGFPAIQQQDGLSQVTRSRRPMSVPVNASTR